MGKVINVMETDQVLEKFLISVEKKAFRMAYLGTSNYEDAMDIVQDAMFKLVKHYRGRSEQELAKLFTRILQNRIRDWYRTEKVKNSINFILGKFKNDESENCSENPIEQFPDQGQREPPDVIANEDAIVKLDEAVHLLPQRQKQVFLLRLWQGLDVSQTAKAMGCSNGSVKSHYSRAIHSLRKTLGDYW